MFAFPDHYVERSAYWADVDLVRWSKQTYEWTRDDWSGVRDFAQSARRTYETGRGDCEDYALVAANVLASRDRSNLHFAIVSEGFLPEHFVLYDAVDQQVYSSGRIYDATLSEYLDESRYVRRVTRRIV
ncbi:hypothetical protein [Halorussus sp. MSC15.2]|uniref:hypothetical protein n=1 Tax=Halorussus sp. MSC15.2 TaxID=2283638 RepID=UPI0013D59007|nr:hypothetical protein [Halorussus sp. MSC15.2]NEU58616.1 hypothetical protein [Halorussus sp. MSC15.2]